MAHQPLWSKLDFIYKLPLKSFFIQQKQKGNLSEASSRVCVASSFNLNCYRRIQIIDSEAFSLTQIHISYFLHLSLSFSFFLHPSHALVLLVSHSVSFFLTLYQTAFFSFFSCSFFLYLPLSFLDRFCVSFSLYSPMLLSLLISIFICLIFFRFASHFFTLSFFLHSLSLSLFHSLCSDSSLSFDLIFHSFFLFLLILPLFILSLLSLRLTFPKTYLQR